MQTTATTPASLAAPWTKARTLADLGHLTGDWLEGRLEGEHPGGYDRPDDETVPLIPSLAAANRTGLVTIGSQPGVIEEFQGQRIEQHAWVEVLTVDQELLLTVTVEAWRRGIHVVAHEGPGRDLGYAFPITIVDGGPFTWAGRRYGYDDLTLLWEGCHRDSIAAVVGAWQVTLIDPVVGCNGRLWRVLDGVRGRSVVEATA